MHHPKILYLLRVVQPVRKMKLYYAGKCEFHVLMHERLGVAYSSSVRVLGRRGMLEAGR